MASLITRNDTALFVKLRAEQKNKKNRFGYSILGGHSQEGWPSDAIRLGENTGNQRLLTSSTDDDSHRSGPRSGANVEVEMTPTLPPLWVDLISEVQDDITKLKEKMSALQKAEQRRLLKVFSTSDESSLTSATNRDIEMLTADVSKLFQQIESSIHKISSKDLAGKVSPSEVTLRRNAQRSAATQLQQLSQQFRSQQKNYLNELRKRRQGSSYGGYGESQAGGLPNGEGEPGMRFDTNDQQVFELDNVEAEVDQRNEEIARIAQSVGDLHNIFKQLSVLVIDQGTVLDRIDYNVEQVVSHTQHANVHIAKAEQYQKSARAGAVTGCLIVAIVLLLILWIIKHTL